MNLIIIFIAKYLLFVSMAIAIFYFLKQPWKKQKEIFIFVLIIFPVSYIVAKLVSRFYFDPRPFAAGNFTPLLPHAADNGFPSDHALLGAAIAFAVFHFNKKLGVFLFFLAILVGVSRVLAGVHHTADIAGSMIIVGLIYLLAAYSTRKKE